MIEFFDIPPEKFLYQVAHAIPNFNIQISAESHDPLVRSSFQRNYDNSALEKFIEHSLKANCRKFDLFFMIGLPHQTYDSVLETVKYCDYLLDKFNFQKRLFPYISPLAPFLDPGSLIFENPEKYGYKLIFRTLEEHRKALESPSWRYMLNYQTEWMNREEIVSCTYDAASKMNHIKYKHNLFDERTYKKIENRIRTAVLVMRKIDRMIEEGNNVPDFGSAGDEAELKRLEVRSDLTCDPTLCEKSELEWPLRFFQGNMQKRMFKYAFYFLTLLNFLRRPFSGHKRLV